MTNPRGYSDHHMLGQWRRAVRVIGGLAEGDDSRQCHHIIKVEHPITRYDWRNGMLQTLAEHGAQPGGAHGPGGKVVVWEQLSQAHQRYLGAMMRVSLAEYLVVAGMSRTEFLEERKSELRAAVRGEVALWDARWFEVPEAAREVLRVRGMEENHWPLIKQMLSPCAFRAAEGGAA